MIAESNQYDDNATLQREELEALSSIYGGDFTLEEEDPPTFTIVIPHQSSSEEKEAALMVTFETEYPFNAPPLFQLSIPWIRGDDKVKIIAELEQIYLDHMGESIVYLWIEQLRELLGDHAITQNPSSNDALSTDIHKVQTDLSQLELSESGNGKESAIQPSMSDVDCQSSRVKAVTIYTGEPFTDRKSTFQAHLATISDQVQVRMVLDELYKNKKIATATHNMYAYRISNEKSENAFLQDCDDDGETHAGSRLLHLLQILDCRNVMVVVTRWYGGIQLHGDRFKHINNVARQLLQQQGFVHSKVSKK